KSSSVFTKSCQTIRNWFGEIISYFERRTTNGMVEGINNKLKLIKRRAYGEHLTFVTPKSGFYVKLF
ncbi:transposase, partial [Microcystis aeruginosa CS-555/01A07]|uniref:transposase n=1 Tax=Microcystis aeruginosa TaxID=1126 RepID=UPI00232C624E